MAVEEAERERGLLARQPLLEEGVRSELRREAGEHPGVEDGRERGGLDRAGSVEYHGADHPGEGGELLERGLLLGTVDHG